MICGFLFQKRKIIGRLFSIVLLLFLHVTSTGGSLYQCLIPFGYCLGPFLPIGYAMQTPNISAAVIQLHQQCPTLESVESCISLYPCSHEVSRRRVEAFLNFFTWLCHNTPTLEQSTECWEFPFDNDVITCGERYIAGEMGSRLREHSHPCPFIQEMVVCIRERMLRRRECSDDATELYVNVIIQSSIAFSDCSA